MILARTGDILRSVHSVERGQTPMAERFKPKWGVPMANLHASELTIQNALAEIKAELDKAADAIRKAAGSEAGAYRAIVKALASHASQFVLENGRLRPGTLKQIARDWPDISAPTLSSAWGAFKRNADAFAACTAVRKYQDLARDPSADTDTDTDSPAKRKASALKALSSAFDRAAKVGVSRAFVDELVSAYAPAPVVDTAPAQNEAPKPTPKPARKPKPTPKPAQVDVVGEPMIAIA